MTAEKSVLRQDEIFLRRAFHKSLFPCILSILSQNLNILADGVLVGQRIGTNGLSAISLCVPVYLVLCVVGSFLVSGTAIQASKAIGRQQPEKSRQLYSTAVWSAMAASLVVTVLGLALLSPLTAMLCPDPAVQPLVRDYTAVTLAGALPKILIYVPFWFLRMDGRGKLVAWMMLVMGGGNILLDLLFLYPLNWGVAGAAWASVLSTAVACVLGFICLGDRHSGFRLGRQWVKDLPSWREIAADGSPSALNNLFQTLRLLAVNSLLMGAGGSQLVAAFTAVNCISAFSLSVVDGVPQAASAMLGIYSGERDNDSAALLIRREWRTGALCCVAFSLVIILSADGIAAAYGLSQSLRLAMVCLSIGMFPALWCSILSGYYNVSGHVRWANAIIFSRVFLFAALSLYAGLVLDLSPWWFLVFSEWITVVLWYAATCLFHKRHPRRTRFLLMDRSPEREGRVVNFSVAGNDEQICEASQKIADFCLENQMNPRQIMRLSLALEEVMTMIVSENQEAVVRFDVRAFSAQQDMGIRIRYDGKAYNPFDQRRAGEERYLGIEMISNMMETIVYQRTFGVNTIQLLL